MKVHSIRPVPDIAVTEVKKVRKKDMADTERYWYIERRKKN